MLKKSLLSLAIAAGLGLAGCSGTDSTGSVDSNGGNPDQRGADQGSLDLVNNPGTYPLYDPGASVVPVPSDLQYSGTTDGTIVFSGETSNSFKFIDPDTGTTGTNFNPVTNALADMDGASVLAQIDLPFSGSIDATTVVANQSVFLVQLVDCQDADGNDRDPITGCLANGELTYINPAALDGSDVTTISESFGDTPNFRAEVITHTGGTENSVLRITPLEPLDGATRYMVFLTNGIKTSEGESVNPSVQYNAIGGDEVIPVALEPVRSLVQGYETLAGGYVATILTDALTNHLLYLASSGTQGELLSTENQQLLADFGIDYTTIVDLATATAAITQASAATPDSVVMSYSFTTGGTNEVLSVMTAPGLANSALQAAQAHPTVAATFNAPQPRAINITKTEVIEGMDVRVGTIDLPYFLTAPSFYQDLAKAADPAEQLTAANVINAKWQANDEIDDLAATLGAGFEALGAITPPTEKVTRFFPFAKATGTLQAPIEVFLPAGAPTQTIIYQHGLGTNRSIAISFAKQMTAAGYAVVAMDYALHGLEPTDFVDALGLIDLTSTGAKLSPLNATTVDTTSKVAVTAEAAGIDTATVAAALAAVAGGSPTAEEQAVYNVFVSVSSTVAAIDDAVTTVAAYAADNSNPAPTATQVAYATAYQTVSTTDNYDVTDPAIQAALAYQGYQTATLGQYMVNENHFGLTTDNGSTPRAISAADLVDGSSESGKLFVYPLHFQITRDNFRQSVMGLLNLGASLGNISTEVGVTLPQHDGTKSLVNFVGHSFGAILGASYASINNTVGFYNVNNNAIVQGAIAQLDTGNPTLNATFQGALSTALGTDNLACDQASTFVLDTLQPIEDGSGGAIPAGTAAAVAASDEVKSLNVLGCGNSNLPHLQTVTLVNGSGSLAKLNEHSPEYAPPVIAGLTALGIPQGSASFEAFMRVLQGTLDSVDPLSLSASYSSPLVTNTTGVLSIMVEDDDSVLNSADDSRPYIYAKAPVANTANNMAGFSAPLVGTEPQNIAMGLTDITAGATGDGTSLQQVAVRFHSNHAGTEADPNPDHNTFELNSLLTADPDANEQEMTAIVQSFINFSGTVVSVGSVAAGSIEATTAP
ncbi:hypothetical protein [Litoribrevibacter albus]|uniref:Bacterial virulence factor lipase N-terminal domain-containing protein n=1 Tax=Litoribrevibacter albus TaxID=1473156 RepID=A0AA37SBA7_9GAMM|nr:hypothetical protein [Litoribrevibacter albus]GLQ31281.1 hypothetical protein GCM10007876_17600 [Litoribrevibacter albus]